MRKRTILTTGNRTFDILVFIMAVAALVIVIRSGVDESPQEPKSGQAATAHSTMANLSYESAPMSVGTRATTRNEVAITEADIVWLARNIYHEARGEPRVGQAAVAQVVLNRVRSDQFPNTIAAVVQQGGERPLYRCQFSWWCDSRSDTVCDCVMWYESRAVAEGVLRGNVPDPTGGATFYLNPEKVKEKAKKFPSWTERLEVTYKVGEHVFFADSAPPIPRRKPPPPPQTPEIIREDVTETVV